VSFGAACSGWLLLIVVGRGTPALHAAGLAWFLTWGTQIVVSATSWILPFSFPSLYYRSWPVPCARRLARWFGVVRFGRWARRINPLQFDRRSPRELESTMTAAETTHAMTLLIVTALAVGSLVRGSATLALFLGLWNVLFNLYPVALQRHNRARLRRVSRQRAAHLEPISAGLSSGTCLARARRTPP
jgi:hypothetical protein